MKIQRDHIEFSSGNTMHANCGIVGLPLADPTIEFYSAELDDLVTVDAVHGGYDNTSVVTGRSVYGEITHADAVELADYMIGAWAAFKERHLRNE